MLRLAAVTAALVGLSMPALADFSGYYAPGNWMTNQLPDPSTDGGSMDISSAPMSITLIGSNKALFDDANPPEPVYFFSELGYTITAPASGTVSFSWSYVSSDSDGPLSDPAGYHINGSITQLSDNDGLATQPGGNVSFVVLAGQTFGFYLNSNDNHFGNATLTITNFMAPIPEPASVAMMSLGLLGVAVAAARRRRSN